MSAYAGIFGGLACVPSFIIAIFTNQLSNAFVPDCTGTGMYLGFIWGALIARRTPNKNQKLI